MRELAHDSDSHKLLEVAAGGVEMVLDYIPAALNCTRSEDNIFSVVQFVVDDEIVSLDCQSSLAEFLFQMKLELEVSNFELQTHT